ncbi:MAG: TonB-dependent receptor, partial [Fibrobacterota bacterium]
MKIFKPLVLTGALTAHLAAHSSIHEYESMEIRESAAQDTTIALTGSEVVYTEDRPLTGGGETAEGLLASIAGVDVSRSSATGDNGRSAVSVRGLDDKRMVVALNGRLLNGAGVMGGKYVDWSAIPVDDIKKIVLIRGYKDAEFGNTLGGVINIITHRTVKDEKTAVSAQYGLIDPDADAPFERQMQDVGFTHRSRLGDLGNISLSLSRYMADPFLRNNYTDRLSMSSSLNLFLPGEVFLNASIKRAVTERGFAIANDPASAWYDGDYPVADGSAGGGPGIKWKGGDYIFGDRSYWKNTRTQFDVTLEKKINRTLVQGILFFNDQDRWEYYSSIQDSTDLVLSRFAEPEDMTGGWKLSARFDAGRHSLKYGTDGIRLRSDANRVYEIDTAFFGRPLKTPYDTSAYPKTPIKRAGFFIHDEISLMDERLRVNAGLRADFFRGDEDTASFTADASNAESEERTFQNLSPALSAVFDLSETTTMGISGALAHRYPGCPEYYWYFNGYQPEKDGIDRKSLRPEQSLQADLFLRQSFLADRISLQADVYIMSIDDYLSWIMGYKPSRV